MKALIVAICLVITGVDADVAATRKLFWQSYVSETDAKSFYTITHAGQSPTPLHTGYKGIAEIMMCRYAYNPLSKLAYFKRGKQLLEDAIFAEKENVELRYLRFTVQTNVPKILGYDDDIAADKKILMAYVQQKQQDDVELYEMVKAYLSRSNYVSNSEKAAIACVHPVGQ